MLLSGSPSNGDGSSTTHVKAVQMNVENVEVVNRSDGIITVEVTVDGEMDENRLKQALFGMFGERKIDISTIKITDISGNVSTVLLVTKGHASSAQIETQLKNHLSNKNNAHTNKTATEDTGESSNSESVYRNPNASHYQIDFVRGEPIENLQGAEGTYTNDQLIRFAHGSSDRAIYRPCRKVL